MFEATRTQVEHIDIGSDERQCLWIDEWFRDRLSRKAIQESMKKNYGEASNIEVKHPATDAVLLQVFDDLVQEVRERVWIARILNADLWPVLFICGSEHVVSVARLLHRFWLSVKIIHYDFEG